jgi:hypothetical protein
MRGRNSKLYKQAGSTRDVGDGEPSAMIDLESSTASRLGRRHRGGGEGEIANRKYTEPGVEGLELWKCGMWGHGAGGRLRLISHQAINGSTHRLCQAVP